MYLGTDEFFKASANVVTGLWSHEQVERLDSRTGTQELLDEHFAHETRTARDEHGTVAVESDNV